ncbi:TetR family transcriptional regulator [Streptacidiphilus sp. MAP12-33]|uniref:TetR family transcriptional regulator n=1 Tax=Streptacidiphilus sp. MAP12-33 TaxID=3156266 RepID=UPI0035117E2C
MTTQPSLTERRKAATQLDIARAAAELFAERGPDGTTAEEISGRAGIALRTFYRYFRNKEDAVSPLLSAGGARWRALVATEAAAVSEAAENAAAATGAAEAGAAENGAAEAGAAGAGLREALVRAARASLTAQTEGWSLGHGWAAAEGTRGLLRAAADDAALRAVWYRVNQESEEQLTAVLASLPSLAGREELELRMIAAGATDAIRLALESWAASDAPVDDATAGPATLVEDCLRKLLHWL